MITDYMCSILDLAGAVQAYDIQKDLGLRVLYFSFECNEGKFISKLYFSFECNEFISKKQKC